MIRGYLRCVLALWKFDEMVNELQGDFYYALWCSFITHSGVMLWCLLRSFMGLVEAWRMWPFFGRCLVLWILVPLLYYGPCGKRGIIGYLEECPWRIFFL